MPKKNLLGVQTQAKKWFNGEPLSKEGATEGEMSHSGTSIVGKRWDPGILYPSRFSGQIRKVEARLGKLANIRKIETD